MGSVLLVIPGDNAGPVSIGNKPGVLLMDALVDRLINDGFNVGYTTDVCDTQRVIDLCYISCYLWL